MFVGDGSVDYKGRPANRLKTGGWRTSPYNFCKSLFESRPSLRHSIPIFLTSALVEEESNKFVLVSYYTPHFCSLPSFSSKILTNPSRAMRPPRAVLKCSIEYAS